MEVAADLFARKQYTVTHTTLRVIRRNPQYGTLGLVTDGLVPQTVVVVADDISTTLKYGEVYTSWFIS